MWRVIYYGLLAGIGIASATTLYARSVNGTALFFFALLSLTVYFLQFFWWLGTTRPDRPIGEIRKVWRRRTLEAFDRASLFISSNLFFVWLPPIKMSFADAHGFWADPGLIALDRWIFGTDPWRLTHAAFGSITPAIDYLYASWLIVVVVASLSIATFADQKRVTRYFLGIALSWTLLGILMASSLASAGPIFGPDLGLGFEGLREALKAAPTATTARELLWQAQVGDVVTIGAGISAMPSMHCALTFLIAFTAYRTRWFVPAVAYTTAIWIGSVHLGWHYFTDGLVSLAGVALIWFAIVRSGEFELSGFRLARKQASIA